jgi:hypothetical protein
MRLSVRGNKHDLLKKAAVESYWAYKIVDLKNCKI